MKKTQNNESYIVPRTDVMDLQGAEVLCESNLDGSLENFEEGTWTW